VVIPADSFRDSSGRRNRGSSPDALFAYENADWSLDHLVPHAYHMARTGIAVSRYAADLLAGAEAPALLARWR
jgi:hypothetical protein